MGRPRQFDLDQAIDAASRLFQEQGYGATSVADLLKAIGVEKGSLYKAFRDKRTLFLLALDRYLDRGFDTMRVALTAAPDARAGIDRWLAATAQSGMDGGCFAIQSLVERKDSDAVVDGRLENQFRRMESLLIETIERGQREGGIDPSVDATRAARTLQILANGMLVSGAAGYLRGAVQDARLLGLAILGPKKMA